MNDWKLAVERLEEVVSNIRGELSLVERLGVYGGVRAILADLFDEVDERFGGTGYAKEKIGKAKWHIGAVLGFDITNGHDDSQHLSWALGALWSLKSHLEQMSPTD